MVLGGAATARPLMPRAQQAAGNRRVGVLLLLSRPGNDALPTDIATFQQELERLGWQRGRNLYIDYGWAGSADVLPMSVDERLRITAADLLALAPDVVLAVGTPPTAARQRLTSTVPVVFTVVSDPVAQGFVPSLAHPGGNMTGISNLEPTVGAKWLELLKQIAPRVTHVAVVINQKAFPLSVEFFRSAEAAASKFMVQAVMAPVHDTDEIEAIMATLGGRSDAGAIFPVDPFTTLHSKFILAQVARHRLPAIFGFRGFADGGALSTYGADQADVHRKAAVYVDRILRGEKPSDLPVQQPTKFELVINLKTARALGLDVPQILLSIANEVIE